MSKKNKDPYPITDVYFVEMNAVDAATVTVGDLCERLSNDLEIGGGLGGGISDITSQLKNIDSSKKNSISFGNGADGGYSIWVGVDQKNKVRKIFAEANIADYMSHPENTKNYLSYYGDKQDINDQFFNNVQKIKTEKKRIKLFDLNTQSGLISLGDFGGPLRFLLGNSEYDEDGDLKEIIDTKYFKKNEIFQNNTPFLTVKFSYGLVTKPHSSSFASSTIHQAKKEPYIEPINFSYTELFSNLLDENCYPTKYIFEDYFAKKEEFETGHMSSDFELKIKKDLKLSGDYISNRLPKAIQILKKQTKILFKEYFKEVFDIRKKQFEDFIFGIIKDIEPQELDLPTFGKKSVKKKFSEKRLDIVSTEGISNLYNGYKLKEDVDFKITSLILPVKKRSYPTYLHCYSVPDEDEKPSALHAGMNNYEYVKIVVEGIEGCYLNKNKEGKLCTNKLFKESSYIRNAVNKKLKSLEIDKIDLRDSSSLKELEKLTFVEELTLWGLDNVTNWDNLSKLKSLKKLKLTQCEVTRKVASNFFKNLYSLRNLEKFEIDDSSIIHIPEKEKFPKHLFLPKLKTFEIEFRKKWKDKTKDEGYENHQGYGNMGTYWLDYNLPTIYNFPNFEKFKSLEKINLYNLFSEETPEGQLFNSAYTNYLKKFEDMGTKVKNFNKLKHIWIHGFELKGDISHQSKNVQECLEALTKHKKVLINGKNIKTTKLNLKGIKKLELICKIEQYWDPKLISQDKDKIILNYFPNIENKEKRDLLNNCLAQKLEEIKVKPAYQFFKSENVWSDTFKPIEDHIKKNKNLKNIIFEFDENFVSEDYGDMVGEWSEWESKTFAIFVKNNLEKNKNLKIKISHPEFNQNFDREKVYNKYIRLLNLYSVINKDKKFSGRLLINELNKGNIENVLLKYYNEKVTSIVIIEDNCGYNSSKKINNIELLEKSDFEFQNPKINAYMEEFPVFDKDRYNPLDSFFEERFWRYASAHDDDNNYNHIWNRLSYEEPIIFVKKDYLDSYKKTLFGNIQHLYYHCIKNFDDETEQSPIFWNKNEKFKIPSSVKVKNLETLHLFGGRDITLEDVNKICGKTIKYLILEDKLVGNYSLPYMPKLEKLIVGQGWDGFKKFSSNFSKLSNIPNIFELGLRLDYDNTSSHLDLSDYKGSGKLKKLSIEHLNPKFTHHLKKLTSLEDLNISLWNEKERVIEKDFEFVKSLKNLIKIKISGGMHASVFINYAKLMEYISPNIQELECDIVYKEDDHQVAYECIKKIISKFKKLKKLKIDCNSCFIDNELRSGEVFNYKNYKYNYNSKTNTFTNLKTKEKFKEGMFKNKLIFDFKKFKKLKNLEEIYLSGDHKAGYILKNENEILTAKKLIRIKFPTKNFSSKLLKKIKQRLDNYLNKCRKLKKYKSKTISSEYSLEDKERKEYLSMDIKFGYGWGETAEAILEERQKKKNSNA